MREERRSWALRDLPSCPIPASLRAGAHRWLSRQGTQALISGPRILPALPKAFSPCFWAAYLPDEREYEGPKRMGGREGISLSPPVYTLPPLTRTGAVGKVCIPFSPRKGGSLDCSRPASHSAMA